VSDKRRIRGQLSERSATLADPSRLMLEEFDRLDDLENATAALGEVLVAAGLPRRAWRSEQATLRLLSEALPAITLGAFLARLELFAARSGPAWLRGAHDDLKAFHAEVGILSEVARPLLGAVRGLQRTPSLGRRRGTDPARSLQQVLRHPRLEAPLSTIVEILSGFEARAPLMRALQSAQPLPPVHKGALPRTPRAPDFPLDFPDHGAFSVDTTAAGGLWTEEGTAHEITSPAAMVRARAAALAARIFPARGAVPTLPMGLVGFRQRLSFPGRWPRGWRLAASAVLALAVVVVGTLLILSHRSPASSLTSSASSHSSPAASLTALAGSATATTPTTGAPTAAPSATAGPVPKLALSCTLQGATATLTLKNVGTASLTWQVQPSPTLTAAPAQGTLDVGQSAVVQVSAKNKKTPTGTIRVVANHGNLSTDNRVSCR
jgi:hypothetical protein